MSISVRKKNALCKLKKKNCEPHWMFRNTQSTRRGASCGKLRRKESK